MMSIALEMAWEAKRNVKEQAMRTIKYYIMPKNELGQRRALKDQPVNMEGVDVVEVPWTKDGWLYIASKGKSYQDFKVAKAIAAGQLSIDDVRVA